MNTNTQKLVFSKLSIQKPLPKKPLVNKQKLGAIEDAVNEVKNDLSNKADMIGTLINDYNSDIKDIEARSRALAEDILNLMMEADGAYKQYEEEYLATATELDSLGIPYDSVFPDYGSDYNDAKDYANNLMYRLEQ